MKFTASPIRPWQLLISPRVATSHSQFQPSMGVFTFLLVTFFSLHFLTLQVVFILKTIELPTLWYDYNFIIVKKKKHDLHLKTKIHPKNKK